MGAYVTILDAWINQITNIPDMVGLLFTLRQILGKRDLGAAVSPIASIQWNDVGFEHASIDISDQLCYVEVGSEQKYLNNHQLTFLWQLQCLLVTHHQYYQLVIGSTNPAI